MTENVRIHYTLHTSQIGKTGNSGSISSKRLTIYPEENRVDLIDKQDVGFSYRQRLGSPVYQLPIRVAIDRCPLNTTNFEKYRMYMAIKM